MTTPKTNSLQHRKAISRGLRISKNRRRKIVAIHPSNRKHRLTFSSQTEAAEILGCSVVNVSRALNPYNSQKRCVGWEVHYLHE